MPLYRTINCVFAMRLKDPLEHLLVRTGLQEPFLGWLVLLISVVLLFVLLGTLSKLLARVLNALFRQLAG
ncbi:MAG: hypothetical protein IPN30_02305 [Flavobacteriales bacterium]|nr:hypothetical protein [Flavobacteriales bacterium]